jgi:hypothetical protein
MKRRQYKLIFPACLSVLVMMYACSKDFLNKPPLGSLSPDVLATKAGVEGLLVGAYAQLDGQGGAGSNSWGAAVSNWTFGGVAADDSYKGSIAPDQFTEGLGPIALWSVDASNAYVEQKWQSLYDGIQRANDVLRIMPLASDIPTDEQTTIQAEARFLRAHYHFEAKKMWNMVPYVDENVTVGNNNFNVPNDQDIWPNIEADFQFAIDNLPDVQPQVGRANKWAAMTYLAKVYMYQDKYDQAKPLLDQVITSGVTAGGKHYALVHYEENFNAAADNSAESVFAAQMSVNDGSGTNGNYGDNLNFPNSGGPGGCCGFNNPSINLANAYKTDANGLPLLDTWNSGNTVSDPTTPYSGSLDPRIDWVMGRPGIPYLDWGLHPGAAWIRDPATDGYFSPKKNAYASSQTGSLSSTETSFWGPTQMDANNYNIIRFADVLLWAAECEIEVGTAAKALDYVNQVRQRAADPTGWVYKNSAYNAATSQYTTQTTPADNYLIKSYPSGAFDNKDYAIKAIRFERRLELAMEGQRFFDLQRWDNGTGYMATVLNTYVATEKTRPSLFAVNPTASFTKGKNEIYPIPQNEIDIENQSGTVALKQNPNY